MKALKNVGLWEILQGTFIFPWDIAQAFQYASTESCAMCSCFS
jgi:hypothetical protein